MMNEIITRAINSINRLLEQSESLIADCENFPVNNILNCLNQLLEPDAPINNWTRLFCGRLNRLMVVLDCDGFLPRDIWVELHEDIIYVLEGPNGEQYKASWKRFLKKMEFEDKLEQRESHFRQNIGEQKNLHQLLSENTNFFKEYLRKCISLHSKVQVQGLIENMDDFCRVYGITETSCTWKSQSNLNEKLQCIEIDFDCSNQSLRSIDSDCFTCDNSYMRASNNPNNFLPSEEQIVEKSYEDIDQIEYVLRDHRRLVILGDPGSAKTTLLRWITRVVAEKVDADCKKDDYIPIRIPILIRIGEFAEWLDQHEAKTLMDYIGEHTWFSERYCHSEGGCVLKESIYHGHALILLDGLDEIREIGQRKEIVDLVKNFIEEYLCTSYLISPFDDKRFNNDIIKRPLLGESIGNRIVVTSRLVGYRFSPLSGPFIGHYLLQLMNHKQAKNFVKKWRTQIEQGILNIFVKEGININKKAAEILRKKRRKAVKAMFQNGSKLLMSNPSLLSLISTNIFQSPDKFCPKSRVDVYNHTIQVALHLWTSKEPIFSKEMLTNFLIDLSTYLHLHSPSGLIDEFDIEHLCCSVLQQQSLSNNRQELRENANKLISLLKSNGGIATERGLDIFGFQHLSLQEYFVALSFVKDSSIENIVKSILSFTINPRFRESLLLSIGWISLMRSFDEYDQFCNLLLTETNNYSIPFGTLLFFDAINDLQRLPSNKVIFIALNNLLDHSSNVIRKTYLISNLLKLPKMIIIEWMQIHLKDEKYLFNFCQSFSMQSYRPEYTRKLILPIVYQQLWLLHTRSSSIEFIIDQTLRKRMTLNDLPNQIFNKGLSFYYRSNKFSAFNIHPLIISVMIALCGGIYLKEDTIKFEFSTKQMHRESSILEYFYNNKEFHSIQIQTFIQQYENILQNSLPSDISIHIVDTFIALICLQGVSQPLFYQKYDGYQALLLAINRLKQTWFYLKTPFVSSSLTSNKSLIKSEMESIMNVFFSQTNLSDKQRISFSVACASAWKKLGMWDLSNQSDLLLSLSDNVHRYFQCQPQFIHFITNEKLDEIAQTIRLEKQLFFLLNFLSPSLQKLYYCTTFSPIQDADSLPLVVFLSQCLLDSENVNQNDLNSCLTLPILHPLLKEHYLENYALVLFQEKYSNMKSFNQDRKEFIQAEKIFDFFIVDQSNDFEEFIQAMIDRKLFDSFLIDQTKDYEILINVERQRIYKAHNAVENQERNNHIFAALISLARLFQAEHRSNKYKTISLNFIKSEEVLCAIRKLLDPILRIIAFSIILEMKDPLIFDEERRDQLRNEMINELQYLLPHLSLTISTFLFVRCHTIRRFYSGFFIYMAKIIGEKLNEISTNERSQKQEAAFITLRQLHNSDLSPYLSEFAKRTKNLSDLLHFNSTIFYEYLTNTKSFNSLNILLLSSMYLAELSFDVQILQMYTEDDHLNNIRPLQELKQLWDDSSKEKKIMTSKVATWISNHLKILNKEDIDLIIKDVSSCSMIERKVLTIIEKWLDYRMNEDLRFFAHYAALQLLIEGSNIPNLIDILDDIFHIDRRFRLKYLVEHLFNSRLIDLITLRQILTILHRNIRYSSNICLWITRKEFLDLILNLEYERIISNVCQPSKPFSSMIRDCSEDLQDYLAQHLRRFLYTQNEIDHTIKEEYVAVIIQRIIEISVQYSMKENCSMEFYNLIFSLFYDQRLSRVHKTILYSLNSVFSFSSTKIENIFIQDNAITNLEKMICLWSRYQEDTIAIGLLTYANCLLKLQQLKITRNISDEVKNTLDHLFETSSSEIISIRAGFCRIFAQYSDINYNTIIKWFSDKSYVTPEKRYKILLQDTLYRKNESWLFSKNENDIEDIETISLAFIDTFIIDLYNYLCNKNDNNYLYGLAPDYINIALKVSEKNLAKFRNAIEQSSFGEKEFKTKLYLYCKNNPNDSEISIKLLMMFGTLTVELVDMLEQIKYEIHSTFWHKNDLKQVSNRDAIEQLFRVLNVKSADGNFINFLNLLKSVIHTRDISLVEVHRTISLRSHITYDDGYIWQTNEKEISDLLLNFDYIQSRYFLPITETGHPRSQTENVFFTEDDIEEGYEKEIVDLEKNSSLFLPNQYLTSP